MRRKMDRQPGVHGERPGKQLGRALGLSQFLAVNDAVLRGIAGRLIIPAYQCRAIRRQCRQAKSRYRRNCRKAVVGINRRQVYAIMPL